MWRITRYEESKGEIFVNIEIEDELGMYNFGRWLPNDIVQDIQEDFTNTGKSIEAYIVNEEGLLYKWAESKLEQAKMLKLQEIHSEKDIILN